jgi:hypothetical protein
VPTNVVVDEACTFGVLAWIDNFAEGLRQRVSLLLSSPLSGKRPLGSQIVSWSTKRVSAIEGLCFLTR